MTQPTPNDALPGAGAPAGRPLVDQQLIERQLAALASVDISEHAGIYEQLLGGLQHELNRTGRGGQ